MRFSLLFFAADGEAADAGTYELLMNAARLADDSAITAVWLPERHFATFGGPYPNPAVLAAALAVQTERLILRAGSVIVPLHDPLRVAEEWAIVDNLSRGRVELSFGSGWNVNDFVLAPQNYSDRREVMYRGIDTVRALWRGERVSRVNGAGQSFDVGTLPRPIQPELPVWLTVQSEPSFAYAAQRGFPVLTNLNFNSPDTLTKNIDTYRTHADKCPDAGRSDIALMVHTFAGADDASARSAVAEPLRRYLRSNLDLRGQFAAGKPGQGGPAPTESQVSAIVERGVDRITNWAGLIGGFDALPDRVRHFADQGVDELACLIDFGVDAEQVERSVLRLCELAERSARIPARN